MCVFLTVKADIDDPFAEHRKFDGTQQYAFAKRTQIELTGNSLFHFFPTLGIPRFDS
jgi:hypothetical protein